MCILKKIKMDSFEVNKIIAAVLVTVLIVFGVGKISDIIFHVEAPKVQGYKVEVKLASSSSTESSSESQIDIAALLSMGNIEHGKKVFKNGQINFSYQSLTSDFKEFGNLGASLFINF